MAVVPAAPVVLGVAMVLVVLAASGGAAGQLRMGFYAESCPGVERVVGDFVRQHVRRVPTVAAALLRLHFHDCFVRVRACVRVRVSVCVVHCVAWCQPVRALTAGVCMCVMCPTTRSLVPAGLRRLRPAQLHRRQRGREGRAAEPDAARLRPRRPRQGARRGCLPRRRLLRRRPRARRPGRGRRHRA
jgi:hypothetical protein